MDINEILKTKLEQTIDSFNQLDKDLIKKNIAASNEVCKMLDKVSNDIHNLKISEDVTINHFHEHKHLNAGVKFMLIMLLSVILSASGFCWYYNSKYNDYKQFAEHYEQYQQNIKWSNSFFNYMYQKNPKDIKRYLKENPISGNWNIERFSNDFFYKHNKTP